MKRKNFPHRKAKRREEAISRDAERASRSVFDQLAVLDAKLGIGKGAKRERARLAEEIRDLK